LFEKFLCYCTTGKSSLQKSIADAETKVPLLESSIKESKALKTQLEADLEQHKKDRSTAKATIAKALAIREKENADFLKETGETKSNMEAINKAITALEKGMGGFLQTSAAAVVRRLTVDSDTELSPGDRDILSAFLSQKEVEAQTQGDGDSDSDNDGYNPQGGQIVGILKAMKDSMKKNLAASEVAEKQAIDSFESMVAAKKKEIAASTKSIEDKFQQHGETAVQVESLAEDMDDTSRSLEEDTAFLNDLEKNCNIKKTEHEAVKKMRSMELTAVGETIKLLNDDDALELFKKTLPSPSLLQMKVAGKMVRQQAIQKIKAPRHRRSTQGDARVAAIVLALHGRKVSFEKIIAMIDEMLQLLDKEQVEDDTKKSFCNKKLDMTEDKAKVTDLTISDLKKALDDVKSTSDSTSDDIAALEQGIKDLDKQVIEATKNRKEEHEQYKTTVASNKAAKELLVAAKNRMYKFYNQKLYKAPPKKEVSRQDKILESFGAQGGAGDDFFLQLSAHAAASGLPPPPEAMAAYKTKGEGSSAVLEMLDMLSNDLDKENVEAEVEEKDSQADYEMFIKDSAHKRTQDSKTIAEKERAKAELEGDFVKQQRLHKSKLKEAYGISMVLQNLHKECDWILSNWDVRKDAREAEHDSLEKAKAVLTGADFSFVQMSRTYVQTPSR